MKTKLTIVPLFTLIIIAITTSALSNRNAVLISSTLPQNLPYSAYSQHIADEIGWLVSPDSNYCHGYYQIPHYIEDHPNLDEHAPVKITAEGPEILKLNGVSELKDHVVITQPGRIIYADKIFIFRNNLTKKIVKIELIGHVRIYQQNSVSVSDFAMITLYPKTTEINQGAYHYFSKASITSTTQQRFNAWGTVTRGKQHSNKVSVLKNATYSTCSPIAPAWKVSATTIILDKPNNRGEAYNAILRIFNLPIFYFPYYTFQLNNERKSGFLMPVLGHVGNAGTYVGIPYYFNLAPNYDLLTNAEYYGGRGFRGASKFRYLTPTSRGQILGSILPADKVFESFRQSALTIYSNTAVYKPSTYQPYLNALAQEKNIRGQFEMDNTSVFSSHLTSILNLNWVSDPYYINNASAANGNYLSTTNQLLNLLQFQYGNQYWDISTALQGYQTLHMIDQIQGTGQALDQYSHLPDINAVGYFPISDNSDFEIATDYTNFLYSSHFQPHQPEGQRLHLRPGYTYDFEKTGGYVKPQIWFDMVGYDLYQTLPGVSHTSARALPIFDVDSGWYFSRDFSLNEKSYQQTFEPRLFYLYVPYTNQNNLPNFDTIELPFFFDQIFALNAFQSVDRQENSNQVSLGLTSNIISAESGATLLSANLGEIYFIQQPKVCLTTLCQLAERNFSPLVANLSLNPTSEWTVTTTLAWDPQTTSTNNTALSAGYHGDGQHIFGLSYVYVGANAGSLPTFSAFQQSAANQYSGTSSTFIGSYLAWPIQHQWSVLGNAYYNIKLTRFDSLYGGIQYDTCCWSIRFIINRIFTSSTTSTTGRLQNNFDTSYFIEFTLKGLASFGTGSDRFVQSFVPGFNK